ncbi:hypothetical protein CFC21_034994 [Triticum aestivum]|uniref:Uncharacterized protein n=3 Tax=Triticum TaxID=4564 RepID=A0A3B6EEA9_WHEAT|nr:hypothetical protein TRIUR3_31022 [Triticum urartu]KAF7022173.1 hypothetical protein CFC21_034994 [Triticum aestivum]
MAKIKPRALLAQSKQKKSPTKIGPTMFAFIVVGALVVSSLYAYKYWMSNGPAGAESVAGN